ncbi:hypothetical protein [Streptomyces hydrogenans]|uniref:Uncharacterized protein n=1 Tax=Streptomyces hydrogenans TaxID=1873719 RepID=A0ABQ3PQH2_9ACTN|nr:hypothetical protein [Streptomyces hydrogenans]GHG24655.1 hypothetical protein GCM10018784_42570 [Streptomyces hydrogenans]GHI27270.1 hypothetical protein Shyd_86410 [Streptomyces hydrogenans]
MLLSSEDAGIWILPVVLLFGVVVVSPIACAVLAGRVVLRIARSAVAGDAWAAFTPGTWLLAAASGTCGAMCQFTASLFGRPAAWVESASFVCGCFALAAGAIATFTATLNRCHKDGVDRS